ncbi:MAG: hypothetical protein RL490_2810 [Pseudomonadota bacterium]
MTFQLLDLGAAGASLEFADGDLAGVRRAAADIFDTVVETPAVDAQIWQLGEQRLFLTRDWDEYALLADSIDGVAVLRQLHAKLVAQPQRRMLAN